MRSIWLARTAVVMVMVALPAFGFSYTTLTFSGKGIATVSADDSNGDLHSRCHRGHNGTSKGGGNDKVNGGDCGVTQ